LAAGKTTPVTVTRHAVATDAALKDFGDARSDNEEARE
jgi:hypothetical protein